MDRESKESCGKMSSIVRCFVECFRAIVYLLVSKRRPRSSATPTLTTHQESIRLSCTWRMQTMENSLTLSADRPTIRLELSWTIIATIGFTTTYICRARLIDFVDIIAYFTVCLDVEEAT